MVSAWPLTKWPLNWKQAAVYKIDKHNTFACRPFDEIVSAVIHEMPVVYGVQIGFSSESTGLIPISLRLISILRP